MKRIAETLTLIVILSFLVGSAFGQVEKQYSNTPGVLRPYGREPYKQFFVTPLDSPLVYTGPGREKPEPTDIDTVKIGFVGPLYPTVSLAASVSPQDLTMGHYMLKGAQLAVEEANAQGGYRGKLPYKLVKRNDGGLWGAISNEIVDLAYNEKVWAILGSIDGANSHIAIRVALKIEIPMMNTADTDPTFTETKIPWVFRCIADDRQEGYALAEYAYNEMGYKRIAALRSNNRYGRVGIAEFRDASRRLGHPLLFELRYETGDTLFTRQLERMKRARVDAVVVWGNAAEAAHIVKQMRKMGMNQLLLGSDRLVSPEFLEIAGPAAEGTVMAYPYDPTRDDPVFVSFKKRFEERFGDPPEAYAAHAYDGMNMLIEAMEKVGLNRAKIRDALAEMKVYHGVTGEIPFNEVYSDVGPVTISIVQNGKFVFQPERIAGASLQTAPIKRRKGKG